MNRLITDKTYAQIIEALEYDASCGYTMCNNAVSALNQSPEVEIALYQYRWLNPGEQEQPESVLEWKSVEPIWNQTVQQKCEELLKYRYNDKQVYEVRALYTVPIKHESTDTVVNHTANTIELLQRRVAELETQDRALRRLFCATVSHFSYMDDGEASDASEWPHIDYLRDNVDDIRRKRQERGINQLNKVQQVEPRKPMFEATIEEQVHLGPQIDLGKYAGTYGGYKPDGELK